MPFMLGRVGMKIRRIRTRDEETSCAKCGGYRNNRVNKRGEEAWLVVNKDTTERLDEDDQE
ncbi:hypothetical protein M422DRAFT_781501 [Sphaerobolus stellatus SS14]|uniref:Uncharacterized protein n=1 Tax=Sphaerobolus stellatus (strain SS14) TaxID=990650 RepID=A0A0C9U5J2_SPHS4|nr:hypothetical protein M422DRAFT_781501 [Sphaerobolus stellatus SS14]